MSLKHPLRPAVVSIAMLAATISTASAQAQPVGILSLYNAQDPQSLSIDDTKLAALDCTLQRAGIIGAAQGDIGLDQPNQFVLLSCQRSLLATPMTRQKLTAINTSGAPLATLEGDMVNFPDAKRNSAITARQYILKISHYNNADVDARDAELASLTQEAETMADTYVTEAFVGVTHAIGLPTPDEVVVLFYDDPDTGDRFRKSNSGFLGKVGVFNETHLIDTIYYVGQATQ